MPVTVLRLLQVGGTRLSRAKTLKLEALKFNLSTCRLVANFVLISASVLYRSDDVQALSSSSTVASALQMFLTIRP